MRFALAVEGGRSGFPRLAEVAEWLAALGLHDWVPGRWGVPPDGAVVRAALPGVRTPAIRHPFSSPIAADVDLERPDLTSPFERPAQLALSQLVASLQVAASLRSPWCIVPLVGPLLLPSGRDGAGGETPEARVRERDRRLDRLCRALHAASRAVPEVGVALTIASDAVTSVPEWCDPAALALVLEDLGSRRRCGYWHDSGVAQSLPSSRGVPATQWLDQLAPRCIGIDATDAIGAMSGLPAGVGEVDFPALLGALPRDAIVTLRSDPFVGPGPLLAALRHLRRDRAGRSGSMEAR